MAVTRRTTLTASEETLRVLENEARRRSVSLNVVLREAVEERARQLRTRRRPQVAVDRSSDGLSAREVASEPIAEDVRA